MIAVFKKELWAYFGNWSAWVIIASFSLLGSLFLFFFENNFNFFDIGAASMQTYFVLVPWLFMFIIPALSMKTLAEEQQSGTLGWLFSQPLKLTEIIGGKFLSVWLIGVLCLLPSIVYFNTISTLSIPEGNIDFGMTLGGYVGLLLFLCFFMFFGIEQLASYKLLGGGDYILQNLGFYYHYIAFTRGLIDTKDVFYFGLIIFLGLKAAILFVERKK